MLLLTSDESKEGKNNFFLKLFSKIFRKHSRENLIISPKAIELCLGIALLSSEGETYTNINDILHFESDDKFEIASSFHDFFTNCRINPLVRTALNIFPNIQYQLKPQITEILKIALRVVPEYIDFEHSKVAADHINCWTKYKTCNVIKDIVRSSFFKTDTSVVLVSAVYLNATWRIPFDQGKTFDGRFYIRIDRSIPVYMMTTTDIFLMTDLPELEAEAIELGFNFSDISMVIILPNCRTTLSKTIRGVLRLNVFAIFDELKPKKVELFLPKFETEYGLELTDYLREMDLTSIFSESANFSLMLKYPKHVKVSNIFHKVFIGVNEYGTEVGPVTQEINKETAHRKKIKADKRVVVDRPFMYIIKDKTNIYFMGYVVKATTRAHC